jgi:hypothetical protein
MEITMKTKQLIPILGLLLIGGNGFAQFRMSAEYSPRTEYSHGYGTLAADNQEASLFTRQRTRLNADYKSTGIQTRLVLQDVRLWGSQQQLISNEDFGVSLHEAWAEAWFTKGLSLRLGRQELVYDNSRIFGNASWLQQARSHDLALLRFAGYIEVHLGVAYHESGNRKNNFYLGADAYKFMQFLWLHKEFGGLKISLLGLNNGIPLNVTNEKGDITSQEIRFNQTFGPYIEYKKGKFGLAGNAYLQTGKLVNGKTLAAFEYLLEATWTPVSYLTLGAGYEELSGTDMDKWETNANSFNPLFTSGHKFNGHMDYFYAGNHLANVGLRNLYIKTGYKKKDFSAGLDVHHFIAQAEITGSPEPALGTEFDLYLGFRINESIEINGGYSRLFATETLELVKGGSADAAHHWAWIMFTFKPVFLK